MNIGIIPGWLLAAAVAYGVGSVPADLCAAGAAIGIGLSLVVVTRSWKPLSAVFLPAYILLTRYLILPPLEAGPQDVLLHAAQIVSSSTALIAISTLSIIGSYLIGLRWAYTGRT